MLLQVEYGEYMNLKTYQNKQLREELLNKHLQDFFLKSDKEKICQVHFVLLLWRCNFAIKDG